MVRQCKTHSGFVPSTEDPLTSSVTSSMGPSYILQKHKAERPGSRNHVRLPKKLVTYLVAFVMSNWTGWATHQHSSSIKVYHKSIESKLIPEP